MDLTSIKTKLQPMHFEHYNDINEFIGDCKLIFSNCAVFNAVSSVFYISVHIFLFIIQFVSIPNFNWLIHLQIT